MENGTDCTVVTAGDNAFAWGTYLLVASMRMNGMKHPVVAGARGWAEGMTRRVAALGGVTVRELEKDRRCVTCQKPMLMDLDEITTRRVCWADSDAIFIGDCSEWLECGSPDEIVVRKYDPPPADFTRENLETWRRDVERVCGRALPESRYGTRFNAPFIVIDRSRRDFLARWRRQIESVLPQDVEIIMGKGTAYFQTDESVLGSLLCFDPGAPAATDDYKADGRADRSRYFAHFAYNPKPWQMWNRYSMRWRDDVMKVAGWLVSEGYAKPSELPLPLRRAFWPLARLAAPAAPWVWRAIKLKRRILRAAAGRRKGCCGNGKD